ncbi:MAG: PAS domain S-box protein [Kiritimatiellae bacterium]|nr:PAS domain S-box protein [Kiritimatiellia bacterium]
MSAQHDNRKRQADELKRARQEIARLEQRIRELQDVEDRKYRQLVETLDDVVYAVDTEGRITFVSAGVKQFGFEPDKIVGRSLEAFVFPDDLAMVQRDLAITLTTGAATRTLWRGVDKGGKIRFVHDSCSPVRDDAGRIVGAQGILRDVTREQEARTALQKSEEALSRSEEALRRSEERYRLLFENAPSTLWEFDASGLRQFVEELRAQGHDPAAYLKEHPNLVARAVGTVKLIDVNQAGLHLFRAGARDDILNNVEKILLHDAAARFTDHVAALVAGRTLCEMESQLHDLEGNALDLFIRWQFAPGHEQTWDKILVSMLDITKRKRAERALERATKDLIEAEKWAAIGQMASGISHEINQPLTAMQAYTDNTFAFLEQGKLDDVRSNLTLTRELLQRASEITRQLKMLTLGGSCEEEPVCLQTAVNNTLAFLAARARAQGVAMTHRMPPDALTVRANLFRLEQVLMNLTANAFDAMRRSATRELHVSLAAEGGIAVLTVRDSGPGIPDQHLQAVFDPFFTTKKDGGGMGLGLSVSLRIIRDYGGNIEAANHPDGGAVFTVRLPVA